MSECSSQLRLGGEVFCCELDGGHIGRHLTRSDEDVDWRVSWEDWMSDPLGESPEVKEAGELYAGLFPADREGHIAGAGAGEGRR